MSLSTDRLGLNNHEVFCKIREMLPSQQTKTKNLMVCNDDVLFVWNPAEECLLTLSLRSPDLASSGYQTLLPQPSPLFAVERILSSETGRQVAVFGPRGVAVLDVPRRLDAAGKSLTKSCRCRTVLSSPALEVRQVRWHPGSPTDSHLLVLASDNSLRLYNTMSEPEVRQLALWPLGRAPIGALTSTAKLSLLGGLGETAVDFDFAPPVAAGESKLKAEKNASSVAETDIQWPIMVLRGNGDVYWVNASIAVKSGVQSKALVRGPLTVYPPADDNYGVDACSVLVLHTSPPMLVVGTCAGTLYHCLMLSPEDSGADGDLQNMRDLSLVDDEDALRKDNFKMWSLSGQPVLHVLESVELELGLSLDVDLLEDFNCPLHLQKHPTATDRYLVSHEAGIHILYLPVIEQLRKFGDVSDDYADTYLPKFDSQSNAVAEYLLCTRVCGSSNGTSTESPIPSPVLGLALSSSPATLIALLAGGEVVSLLLSSLHLPSWTSYSFLSSGLTSETTKHTEESFNDHIRNLLKHGGTLPIFKFEEKSMATPEEGFKLINLVTQLLYEKYFQRHEQAHEDIKNRMKRLKRMKDQQLSDLSNLEKERTDLKTKVEYLVEKLNKYKTKQEELTGRAEQVLRNTSMKQPVISNAEVQMKKDLTSKQQKLIEMREKLESIRKYSLDQKTQLDRWNSYQKRRQVSINDTHQDIIKTNLKKMDEELLSLVKSVKTCKAELGM